MDEYQQDLILKLTKWLNTQEIGWSAQAIDVTHVSFEVTDAAQTYSILKNEDGTYYVSPI